MRDKLISSEARWCAERAVCWSPGDRAKAADMVARTECMQGERTEDEA